MFYFGFPWIQLVMSCHLFASSMPTGKTMNGQSSAHQTTYNSFWWGQGAKLANIFKNKSWHVPFLPNLFKKFSTGILNSFWHLNYFIFPRASSLDCFWRNAIHPFSKHFHKYVSVQGPGVVGNSDMYHMENSL